MEKIAVLSYLSNSFQGLPKGALVVKNTPANAGSWVGSLRGENPLEEEMATLEEEMVFLAGKSHGQRSLAGYSPRAHKESDRTEAT